ncbi:MAG: hypothetical protein Q8R60_06800 [Mycobacteriales bacterium]|nr:hypothetical protein [Mycobacteriales bacterium]
MTMKVGTWNLQQAAPPGPKAAAQRKAMEAMAADIWLLTEVHLGVSLDDQCIHHSEPRQIKPKQRWSAISSPWPLVALPSPHVGLALARVATPHGSALVACSVMPWRGAKTSWPGEPTAKHGVRFAESLDAHQDAIRTARDGSETVIWGGDFNQALEGRETAGSLAGQALLLEAFESLDLHPVTGHLDHRIDTIKSIDHIAVPSGWTTSDANILMPTSVEGKPLSDHATYLVEVGPA